MHRTQVMPLLIKQVNNKIINKRQAYLQLDLGLEKLDSSTIHYHSVGLLMTCMCHYTSSSEQLEHHFCNFLFKGKKVKLKLSAKLIALLLRNNCIKG